MNVLYSTSGQNSGRKKEIFVEYGVHLKKSLGYINFINKHLINMCHTQMVAYLWSLWGRASPQWFQCGSGASRWLSSW